MLTDGEDEANTHTFRNVANALKRGEKKNRMKFQEDVNSKHGNAERGSV